MSSDNYQRFTLNSQSTYTPFKNLELTVGLNYGQNRNQSTHAEGRAAMGGNYSKIYPYAQLADADGNALPVVRGYRAAYVAGTETLGFKDWYYRPLDELTNGDNRVSVNSLLLRSGLKYRFTRSLNTEIQYQHERQHSNIWKLNGEDTWFARNLINRFSVRDATTGVFNYQVPPGGILELDNIEWKSNIMRMQANYDQVMGRHAITAIAGAEAREQSTEQYIRRSYGYNKELGISNNSLNYAVSLPTNPSGSGRIPFPQGDVEGFLNRFVSFYANGAYTYSNRYTFSLSGRKDGANIFGVNTNQKITPLWSTGLAWTINKESFYYFGWLPSLKLRATYGYSGNVYNGTAYSVGTYITNQYSGARSLVNLTSPNPELRWEKVENINIGIDFSTSKDLVSGTLEVYSKKGQDLIELIPLVPTAGFNRFFGNAASTKTTGIDLTLRAHQLSGKFNWYSTLLISTLNDKVIDYSTKQTASTIHAGNDRLVTVVGRPLYSVFSYRWAGLDPVNGDPQGYLDGKVSKDYLSIFNNFSPDSLVFHGSARPTIFGALRNDFTFRQFTLSVNISYKLGYYFRRLSTTLNYQDVLRYYHRDYDLSWKQPGDELRTDVPSLVYPSNANRELFYQYSEVLVEKGDHIRLQDVRLSYQLKKDAWKKLPFTNLQFYGYANNLGILWKATKTGLDPDAVSSAPTISVLNLPKPFTISFGINANF